jgi:hypothetical protein
VKISLLIRSAAALATFTFLLVSCGKKSTETNSQAAAPGASAAPVDYSPRIGVAVRTSSRTCVAIRNNSVPANSPVTLIVPASPQRYVETQITGSSPSACPITKEVATDMSNYEISLPKSSDIPQLSPMIAVIGSAASNNFLMNNMNVQADLDQNQSKDTFRACGSNDGIHLTVWKGSPLNGTLLWSGYYYEEGNPGTLPTCSNAELSSTPAGRP